MQAQNLNGRIFREPPVAAPFRVSPVFAQDHVLFHARSISRTGLAYASELVHITRLVGQQLAGKVTAMTKNHWQSCDEIER
jgi:hypothetical protein